jgi:hypothetical protein
MILTKEYFTGNRYNFQVQIRKLKSDFLFEINSQHIESKQKSTITNLNFLVSELIQPILEVNIDETTILLDKNQGKRLFKKTISVFKNKSWILLLEENLDEDRNIGGWNASFNF